MHSPRTAVPDPRLAPFVRCYAQREMLLGDTVFIQQSIASLEHILAFDFGDRPVMDYLDGRRAFIPRVHLVGTQVCSTCSASFTGHVLGFGIFLKPMAVWQLFGIPPARLANCDFEARDVLGAWIQELWLKLIECRSFAGQIRVADETLLPFAQCAMPLTPAMATVRQLSYVDVESRISRVARDACMSIRSYQRRFVNEVGISPKLFARVGRFQKALDHKRTTADTWLDVAQELGYFDQMHMLKDFRAFGGDVPTRVIHSCGDFQPWSLGAGLNGISTTKLHSALSR